ncbi:MAG: hypothetical protein IJ574_02695 [Bacilli bacterium]|nr:hypothetical protein [Bacilli bacterium]
MAINSRTSVNYNSFREFNREVQDLVDELSDYKKQMEKIVEELCTKNWAGNDANEFKTDFDDTVFPFIDTYIRNIKELINVTASYYKDVEEASSKY